MGILKTGLKVEGAADTRVRHLFCPFERRNKIKNSKTAPSKPLDSGSEENRAPRSHSRSKPGPHLSVKPFLLSEGA